MKLRDVMLRSVPRLDVDTSLREAARAMSESGMDAVLITDADGRVVGVVSETVLSGVLDHIAMAQERASAERSALSAASAPLRPRDEPLRPGTDRPPHRAVTRRRRRGRSPAPVDVSGT